MKTNMYVAKLFCCGLLALLLISQETAAEQYFCGGALIDILENICVNGYNTMLSAKKRSATLPAYDLDPEAENSIIPLPYASMFMDKMYGDAANMMAKTRRRRHGAYDECCRKSCSYAELMSYCL